MVKQLLSIAVLCAILPYVVAFSIKNNENIQQQQPTSQRRSFLNKISTTFLIATTSSSTIIPTTNNANAVVLDNSQIKVGTLKELTPKKQNNAFVKEEQQSIIYLLIINKFVMLEVIMYEDIWVLWEQVVDCLVLKRQ